MIVVTVTEARAQLSALLDQVSKGEKVIISRAGKPVAILVSYNPEQKPRTPGRLRGKIKMTPDFDDYPSDLAKSLGITD